MQSRREPRIFLSHSSANNDAAVVLFDWLEREGWKDEIFLDLSPERGIAAGQRWERKLNEAADRCEVVLFLVSKAWLGSMWCRKELNLAHRLNKRLYGILVEDLQMSDLPEDLTSEWQVVRLASGRDHIMLHGTLPVTHDPVTVTHELKTVALQQALADYKWNALITGIRRDEDPTRAKERYFSPRNAQFEWDYKDQPPEFWGQFATNAAKGEHVRVQPLLDWTEVDVWRYIQREKIPIPQMYFSRNGKRFRSLGCSPITHPIKSNASNIDEIIAELEATRVGERAGRAQDHYERNAMQKLRARGFL